MQPSFSQNDGDRPETYDKYNRFFITKSNYNETREAILTWNYLLQANKLQEWKPEIDPRIISDIMLFKDFYRITNGLTLDHASIFFESRKYLASHDFIETKEFKSLGKNDQECWAKVITETNPSRMSISLLELDARSENVLLRLGANTIDKVIKLKAKDILAQPFAGQLTLFRIEQGLEKMGYQLEKEKSPELLLATHDSSEKTEVIVKGEAKSISKTLLDQSVLTLNLDTRSLNALKALNVHTIGQLIQKTEQDILGIYNVGKLTAFNIQTALEKINLSLGCTFPNSEIIIIQNSFLPSFIYKWIERGLIQASNRFAGFIVNMFMKFGQNHGNDSITVGSTRTNFWKRIDKMETDAQSKRGSGRRNLLFSGPGFLIPGIGGSSESDADGAGEDHKKLASEVEYVEMEKFLKFKFEWNHLTPDQRIKKYKKLSPNIEKVAGHSLEDFASALQIHKFCPEIWSGSTPLHLYVLKYNPELLAEVSKNHGNKGNTIFTVGYRSIAQQARSLERKIERFENKYRGIYTNVGASNNLKEHLENLKIVSAQIDRFNQTKPAVSRKKSEVLSQLKWHVHWYNVTHNTQLDEGTWKASNIYFDGYNPTRLLIHLAKNGLKPSDIGIHESKSASENLDQSGITKTVLPKSFEVNETPSWMSTDPHDGRIIDGNLAQIDEDQIREIKRLSNHLGNFKLEYKMLLDEVELTKKQGNAVDQETIAEKKAIEEGLNYVTLQMADIAEDLFKRNGFNVRKSIIAHSSKVLRLNPFYQTVALEIYPTPKAKVYDQVQSEKPINFFIFEPLMEQEMGGCFFGHCKSIGLQSFEFYNFLSGVLSPVNKHEYVHVETDANQINPGVNSIYLQKVTDSKNALYKEYSDLLQFDEIFAYAVSMKETMDLILKYNQSKDFDLRYWAEYLANIGEIFNKLTLDVHDYADQLLVPDSFSRKFLNGKLRFTKTFIEINIPTPNFTYVVYIKNDLQAKYQNLINPYTWIPIKDLNEKIPVDLLKRQVEEHLASTLRLTTHIQKWWESAQYDLLGLAVETYDPLVQNGLTNVDSKEKIIGRLNDLKGEIQEIYLATNQATPQFAEVVRKPTTFEKFSMYVEKITHKFRLWDKNPTQIGTLLAQKNLDSSNIEIPPADLTQEAKLADHKSGTFLLPIIHTPFSSNMERFIKTFQLQPLAGFQARLDQFYRQAPLDFYTSAVHRLSQKSNSFVGKMMEEVTVYAIAEKRYDLLAEILRNSKIDPNFKNQNEKTQLAIASILGDVEAVRLYLQNERIDPNMSNGSVNRFTALEAALFQNNGYVWEVDKISGASGSYRDYVKISHPDLDPRIFWLGIFAKNNLVTTEDYQVQEWYRRFNDLFGDDRHNRDYQARENHDQIAELIWNHPNTTDVTKNLLQSGLHMYLSYADETLSKSFIVRMENKSNQNSKKEPLQVAGLISDVIEQINIEAPKEKPQTLYEYIKRFTQYRVSGKRSFQHHAQEAMLGTHKEFVHFLHINNPSLTEEQFWRIYRTIASKNEALHRELLRQYPQYVSVVNPFIKVLQQENVQPIIESKKRGSSFLLISLTGTKNPAGSLQNLSEYKKGELHNDFEKLVDLLSEYNKTHPSEMIYSESSLNEYLSKAQAESGFRLVPAIVPSLRERYGAANSTFFEYIFSPMILKIALKEYEKKQKAKLETIEQAINDKAVNLSLDDLKSIESQLPHHWLFDASDPTKYDKRLIAPTYEKMMRNVAEINRTFPNDLIFSSSTYIEYILARKLPALKVLENICADENKTVEQFFEEARSGLQKGDIALAMRNNLKKYNEYLTENKIPEKRYDYLLQEHMNYLLLEYYNSGHLIIQTIDSFQKWQDIAHQLHWPQLPEYAKEKFNSMLANANKFTRATSKNSDGHHFFFPIMFVDFFDEKNENESKIPEDDLKENSDVPSKNISTSITVQNFIDAEKEYLEEKGREWFENFIARQEDAINQRLLMSGIEQNDQRLDKSSTAIIYHELPTEDETQEQKTARMAKNLRIMVQEWKKSDYAARKEMYPYLDEHTLRMELEKFEDVIKWKDGFKENWDRENILPPHTLKVLRTIKELPISIAAQITRASSLMAWLMLPNEDQKNIRTAPRYYTTAEKLDMIERVRIFATNWNSKVMSGNLETEYGRLSGFEDVKGTLIRNMYSARIVQKFLGEYWVWVYADTLYAWSKNPEVMQALRERTGNSEVTLFEYVSNLNDEQKAEIASKTEKTPATKDQQKNAKVGRKAGIGSKDLKYFISTISDWNNNPQRDKQDHIVSVNRYKILEAPANLGSFSTFNAAAKNNNITPEQFFEILKIFKESGNNPRVEQLAGYPEAVATLFRTALNDHVAKNTDHSLHIIDPKLNLAMEVLEDYWRDLKESFRNFSFMPALNTLALGTLTSHFANKVDMQNTRMADWKFPFVEPRDWIDLKIQEKIFEIFSENVDYPHLKWLLTEDAMRDAISDTRGALGDQKLRQFSDKTKAKIDREVQLQELEWKIGQYHLENSNNRISNSLKSDIFKLYGEVLDFNNQLKDEKFTFVLPLNKSELTHEKNEFESFKQNYPEIVLKNYNNGTKYFAIYTPETYKQYHERANLIPYDQFIENCRLRRINPTSLFDQLRVAHALKMGDAGIVDDFFSDDRVFLENYLKKQTHKADEITSTNGQMSQDQSTQTIKNTSDVLNLSFVRRWNAENPDSPIDSYKGLNNALSSSSFIRAFLSHEEILEILKDQWQKINDYAEKHPSKQKYSLYWLENNRKKFPLRYETLSFNTIGNLHNMVSEKKFTKNVTIMDFVQTDTYSKLLHDHLVDVWSLHSIREGIEKFNSRDGGKYIFNDKQTIHSKTTYNEYYQEAQLPPMSIFEQLIENDSKLYQKPLSVAEWIHRTIKPNTVHENGFITTQSLEAIEEWLKNIVYKVAVASIENRADFLRSRLQKQLKNWRKLSDDRLFDVVSNGIRLWNQENPHLIIDSKELYERFHLRANLPRLRDIYQTKKFATFKISTALENVEQQSDKPLFKPTYYDIVLEFLRKATISSDPSINIVNHVSVPQAISKTTTIEPSRTETLKNEAIYEYWKEVFDRLINTKNGNGTTIGNPTDLRRYYPAIFPENIGKVIRDANQTFEHFVQKAIPDVHTQPHLYKYYELQQNLQKLRESYQKPLRNIPELYALPTSELIKNGFPLKSDDLESKIRIAGEHPSTFFQSMSTDDATEVNKLKANYEKNFHDQKYGKEDFIQKYDGKSTGYLAMDLQKLAINHSEGNGGYEMKELEYLWDHPEMSETGRTIALREMATEGRLGDLQHFMRHTSHPVTAEMVKEVTKYAARDNHLDFVKYAMDLNVLSPSDLKEAVEWSISRLPPKKDAEVVKYFVENVKNGNLNSNVLNDKLVRSVQKQDSKTYRYIVGLRIIPAEVLQQQLEWGAENGKLKVVEFFGSLDEVTSDGIKNAQTFAKDNSQIDHTLTKLALEKEQKEVLLAEKQYAQAPAEAKTQKTKGILSTMGLGVLLAEGGYMERGFALIKNMAKDAWKNVSSSMTRGVPVASSDGPDPDPNADPKQSEKGGTEGQEHENTQEPKHDDEKNPPHPIPEHPITDPKDPEQRLQQLIDSMKGLVNDPVALKSELEKHGDEIKSLVDELMQGQKRNSTIRKLGDAILSVEVQKVAETLPKEFGKFFTSVALAHFVNAMLDKGVSAEDFVEMWQSLPTELMRFYTFSYGATGASAALDAFGMIHQKLIQQYESKAIAELKQLQKTTAKPITALRSEASMKMFAKSQLAMFAGTLINMMIYDRGLTREQFWRTAGEQQLYFMIAEGIVRGIIVRAGGLALENILLSQGIRGALPAAGGAGFNPVGIIIFAAVLVVQQQISEKVHHVKEVSQYTASMYENLLRLEYWLNGGNVPAMVMKDVCLQYSDDLQRGQCYLQGAIVGMEDYVRYMVYKPVQDVAMDYIQKQKKLEKGYQWDHIMDHSTSYLLSDGEPVLQNPALLENYRQDVKNLWNNYKIEARDEKAVIQDQIPQNIVNLLGAYFSEEHLRQAPEYLDDEIQLVNIFEAASIREKDALSRLLDFGHHSGQKKEWEFWREKRVSLREKVIDTKIISVEEWGRLLMYSVQRLGLRIQPKNDNRKIIQYDFALAALQLLEQVAHQTLDVEMKPATVADTYKDGYWKWGYADEQFGNWQNIFMFKSQALYAGSLGYEKRTKMESWTSNYSAEHFRKDTISIVLGKGDLDKDLTVDLAYYNKCKWKNHDKTFIESFVNSKREFTGNQEYKNLKAEILSKNQDLFGNQTPSTTPPAAWLQVYNQVPDIVRVDNKPLLDPKATIGITNAVLQSTGQFFPNNCPY